jgi:NhaA family Na+:H+ antiporter
MVGVGVLAGIGFTMSLFIASLAFPDAERLAVAKMAVLGASLLAGALGLGLLSRLEVVDEAPHQVDEPIPSG